MKLIKNDHLSPELPEFFQEFARKPKMEIGLPEVNRRQFSRFPVLPVVALPLAWPWVPAPKPKHSLAART